MTDGSRQQDIPGEAVSLGIDAWRYACLAHETIEQGIERVLLDAAPILRAAWAKQAGPGIAAWAEQTAKALEAYGVENYPYDIWSAYSKHPDAIGARAMRHAYRNAARIVREQVTKEQP